MLGLLKDLSNATRRLVLAITGAAATLEELTEIGRERAGLGELPKQLQYKEPKQ